VTRPPAPVALTKKVTGVLGRVGAPEMTPLRALSDKPLSAALTTLGDAPDEAAAVRRYAAEAFPQQVELLGALPERELAADLARWANEPPSISQRPTPVA
jgi:hypothetical protein